MHPYSRDLLADAYRRARTAAIKGEPPNPIILLPVLRPGHETLRERIPLGEKWEPGHIVLGFTVKG